MNSYSLGHFLNSSFVDALSQYWDNLTVFLSDLAILLQEKQNTTALTLLESLPDSLRFNEFQCKLLKGFTAVLLINVVLVFAAWKVYGKNICERFMKPATSKAIEELKASVSKLKLPKEHSPRI